MSKPTGTSHAIVSESEIIRRISSRGAALVAMSGGVDSSLVAALAHDALGSKSVAVTLTGPAVARWEVDRAVRVAGRIGISHRVVEVDPLTRPEYRENTSQRCYFCRTVETEALRRVGLDFGVTQLLDGIHADDRNDIRPGIRAMDEAGFDHPLAEADWTKRDVRAAARARNLPNWDQPSDACLSSRIAHGDAITPALLRQVERGEEWLLAQGFRRVRVRSRRGGARVEVDPDEVPRLIEEPMATSVRTYLAGLGFTPVELDTCGYGAHGARMVRP